MSTCRLSKRWVYLGMGLPFLGAVALWPHARVAEPARSEVVPVTSLEAALPLEVDEGGCGG